MGFRSRLVVEDGTPQPAANLHTRSNQFAYEMKWQVILMCLVIVAASAGQPVEDEEAVKEIQPVVQLKRRSLTDQLALWLEDFFEKMVEKMPVDRAEQRAIKSSMQSISNRVSGWSSRISKGIAESWAAFVTFAVLPLLPLDHMPQPLSEAIRDWGRRQWAGSDPADNLDNTIELSARA